MFQTASLDKVYSVSDSASLDKEYSVSDSASFDKEYSVSDCKLRQRVEYFRCCKLGILFSENSSGLHWIAHFVSHYEPPCQ